jgi:hypothetical protein
MTDKSSAKAALIGSLSGAVMFFALGALKAQTALTVADVKTNPKAYVGSSVSVTGLAWSVRSETKVKDGQPVPYVKLNLYELDKKGKKGSRYIYVALRASNFNSVPVEGQMATITGPLKWPYEIAVIDE